MSDRPDECLCDVPPSCSPEDCATTPSRHCCMANGCPIHGDDAQPVPRSLPPEWERLRALRYEMEVEVAELRKTAERFPDYAAISRVAASTLEWVISRMDAIAAEADA